MGCLLKAIAKGLPVISLVAKILYFKVQACKSDGYDRNMDARHDEMVEGERVRGQRYGGGGMVGM